MSDGKLTNGILEAFVESQKPKKPENAITIYRVVWGLKYYEEKYITDNRYREPKITKTTSKYFLDKEKAEAFKQTIDQAFATLGPTLQGFCNIEQEWSE